MSCDATSRTILLLLPRKVDGEEAGLVRLFSLYLKRLVHPPNRSIFNSIRTEKGAPPAPGDFYAISKSHEKVTKLDSHCRGSTTQPLSRGR